MEKLTHESRQPDLSAIDWRPPVPNRLDRPIALIGCGGITKHHLDAYRRGGFQVVALCDVDRSRAIQRRDAYYPEAEVYDDYHRLLTDSAAEVIDVATHPAERIPILEAALLAGKHVLSQKPFVLDLADGQRLVELASRQNRILAVNQNARWAPHFSYLRQAFACGALGQLASVHFSLHWDHSWVEGTPFERIKHLMFYDYGIHWFDMINALAVPRQATRVYASSTRSPGQRISPALQAQAIIEYDDLQVSLSFAGDTHYLSRDRTFVTGTDGTFLSEGPSDREQYVRLVTRFGQQQPELDGSWFPDGFQGAMAELLLAIDEQRQPAHDAKRNLDSLALCFAAIESAARHEVVRPWEVTRLPD